VWAQSEILHPSRILHYHMWPACHAGRPSVVIWWSGRSTPLPRVRALSRFGPGWRAGPPVGACPQRTQSWARPGFGASLRGRRRDSRFVLLPVPDSSHPPLCEARGFQAVDTKLHSGAIRSETKAERRGIHGRTRSGGQGA